jgi:hypothetical protein
MAGPGQIPGRYNLIVEGSYESFDHQMPIEDFLDRLLNDDVPDEVSVIGLGAAFKDGELADELAKEMDKRANDLEYQSPTVQFIVQRSFHRRGKTFDLRYDNNFYPLQEIFGPQLKRKGDGDWLLAPF